MNTSDGAEKSPIKEILCLSNLIKRELDGARIERDDTVTPMHGFIIGYLSRNSERDIFQKDIEKHFSYRRSTASTVLSLMEEKGLITRENVDYDARLKRIVLTDKAKEYAKLCVADIHRLDRRVMSDLDPAEKEQLFGLLSKIRNNLKGE